MWASGRAESERLALGTPYEEQWAGASLPTAREKRQLIKALRQLKDATRLDAKMALILLEINGLDNALEFIARLDQARRWVPPSLPEHAYVLSGVPFHVQTREEVDIWAREHIPRTDRCLILGNWQEQANNAWFSSNLCKS